MYNSIAVRLNRPCVHLLLPFGLSLPVLFPLQTNNYKPMLSPQCDGCNIVLRYCPCCGKRLKGAGPASVCAARPASCLPKSHAGRAVPTPTSPSSGMAWADGLPPRALSAFELYAIAMRREGAAVAAAGERALAQSWLTSDDAVRQEFEERAQAWAAVMNPVPAIPDGLSLGQVDHSSNCGPPPALLQADVVLPTSHNPASPLVVASSAPAAPAAATTAIALTPAAAPSSSQELVPAGVVVTATPRPKKKKSSTSLRKSSYNLFKTKNHKLFSSAEEINRVWRQMSEEDKAPYDAQAALLRTQHILEQNSSAQV